MVALLIVVYLWQLMVFALVVVAVWWMCGQGAAVGNMVEETVAS